MVRFCPLNKVVGPLPNVRKKGLINGVMQPLHTTVTGMASMTGSLFFEWPKSSWVSLGVNFLPPKQVEFFHPTSSCFFWLSSSGLKTSRSPITLSPIIMEVENAPQWKETNIGGTHFPWLSMWWFQIFFSFIPIWGRFLFWLFFRWVGSTTNQLWEEG